MAGPLFAFGGIVEGWRDYAFDTLAYCDGVRVGDSRWGWRAGPPRGWLRRS